MANLTSLSAQQAYERAGPGEHVIGWQIDSGQRRELLSRLPPRYAQVVADHVTLRSKVAADAQPPAAVTAEIVGRSSDGLGVEAMVVRIDGRTERPGGGTFHITWSLEPGREARESNDVIAQHGWQPMVPPVAVQLAPGRYPRPGPAPGAAG